METYPFNVKNRAEMRELIEYVKRDMAPLNEVSWRQVAGGAALIGALATGAPDVALAQTHHAHHQMAQKRYAENDYVDAVIGEAAIGGYRGMLDVACALRNRMKDPYYSRNPLLKVYGKHAAHNKGESKETWDLARKAWADSANMDTVNGATIWGNAKDVEQFQKTKWFKNVEPTVSRLGHTFFKVKKNR